MHKTVKFSSSPVSHKKSSHWLWVSEYRSICFPWAHGLFPSSIEGKRSHLVAESWSPPAACGINSIGVLAARGHRVTSAHTNHDLIDTWSLVALRWQLKFVDYMLWRVCGETMAQREKDNKLWQVPRSPPQLLLRRLSHSWVRCSAPHQLARRIL